MEFYDKFVDKFQDLSNVKNTAVSKSRSNNYLETFKKKIFSGNTWPILESKGMRTIFQKNGKKKGKKRAKKC